MISSCSSSFISHLNIKCWERLLKCLMIFWCSDSHSMVLTIILCLIRMVCRTSSEGSTVGITQIMFSSGALITDDSSSEGGNVLMGVTSDHLVGHTVTFVFRVATQRNSFTKYTGAHLQKLKKGGQYLVFQQWALLRGCAFWEDLKQHGYKQCSESQICAIKPVKFIMVFACALLIYSIFLQSIDINSGPHFASL